MRIKIGTRKSKLALIQTDIIVNIISKYFPDIQCQIVPISTTGDQITNKNLYDIGGKALFLKEIEEHLLDKQIDMAVHSLKDIPGILPEGLVIAAVTEREDPRDCFVSFKYKTIDDLPIGAVVGSSSVRRRVIIQQQRPDIKIVQFRGNIQTRLSKLKNEEVDATILACAGLKRAGEFNPEYCHPLSPQEMLPAAGQGVVAVEVRKGDEKMLEICNKINHLPTWYLSEAERGLLSYLDASCRTPLAAYAVYKGDDIEANYMLSDLEGTDINYHHKVGSVQDAGSMGVDAAIALKNSF